MICSLIFRSISATIALMVSMTSLEISLLDASACCARVRTADSTSFLAPSVWGLKFLLSSEENSLTSIVAEAAWVSFCVSAMGHPPGYLPSGVSGFGAAASACKRVGSLRRLAIRSSAPVLPSM